MLKKPTWPAAKMGTRRKKIHQVNVTHDSLTHFCFVDPKITFIQKLVNCLIAFIDVQISVKKIRRNSSKRNSHFTEFHD